MFVTLHSMRQTCDRPPLSFRSITGRMPSSMNATDDVNSDMWYPGCEAVAARWTMTSDGMDMTARSKRLYNPEHDVDLAGVRKSNVICMQALQIRRDPLDKSNLQVTESQGHWGKHVGQGMIRVLNGQQSTFDVPYYSQTRTTKLA